MEDNDTKTQKRDILEFVKGITNDLIHGNDLQQPDKLGDKVFQAAFLNLRNYLADTIDECTNLKKKNNDWHAKAEDLKKTISNLKTEYYHSTETIEKLRDNIDLKESNQRILEHGLKQCKETMLVNNEKHAATLNEYDNVANEMKLQIEYLEKSNNELSGTVEHLREKMERERSAIEREKEELYQNHVSYEKNSKIYEKKATKLRLEKLDLEKGKEELHETRIKTQNAAIDVEKIMAKIQHERSLLKKEDFDMKIQISDLQKQKSDIKRQISNLKKEKSEVQNEMSNLQKEKAEFDKEKVLFEKEKSDFEMEKSHADLRNQSIGREKQELYQAQMTFQAEIEDFEKALAQFGCEKADLREACKQLKYENVELKKAREQLSTEQNAFKSTVMEYQEKFSTLIEELYNNKTSIEKKPTVGDTLTKHLLTSLEKLEKLQSNVEDKINRIEVSTALKELQGNSSNCGSPVSSGNNIFQSTPNPINEAVPVISTIPLPCQTMGRDVNNNHTFKVDQSSMNPAMLSYNDLTNFNQPQTPLTGHDAAARHVSFEDGRNDILPGQEFCNIKEHTKINDNINRLRDALVQQKSGKQVRDQIDMKWDLCRLEAKAGDAVLKRSLYLNLDRQPRT